jgi:thiol-disulfide isomerase/thioredoxin
MNRKNLLIAGIIVLAIVGGGSYLLLTSSDKTAKQSMVDQKNQNNQSEANGPQPNQSNSSGSYVDYTEDVIAKTSDTKLLFFHAPWCPQCRALEADIKAKGVPEGVTIIKVDYDSNQGLRQKYGVVIQTSLVKVDDQGNLVEKYVAYDTPTLQAVKDNLL